LAAHSRRRHHPADPFANTRLASTSDASSDRDVFGRQHAVEVGDEAVGLAQPHPVERVADRTGVGEQRLVLRSAMSRTNAARASALNFQFSSRSMGAQTRVLSLN
jgi:hypothetical protein